MYQSIYIAVDNSALSMAGVEAGVLLAGLFSAHVVGGHVYAARLHDRRFRQMEGGLPEAFREEKELQRQRDVHDSLITKGLELITDSYLEVFEKRCRQAGASFERRNLEGKHFVELRRDIQKHSSDLVIIGALGLGAVDESVIGSVCERVVRHVSVDALVMKNDFKPRNDPRCRPLLVVAIDGSERSFGALMTALELSRGLGLDVEAVAVFDPFFHTVAFRSIARVLSKEAGKVFRFEEQERLHEEIIDSGLAKIYKAQLRTAERIAERQGRRIRTRLLAGKAFTKILAYTREERPWALILGRNGLHSEDDAEMGSTAENLLRLAQCNVLLSTSTFAPPVEEVAEQTTSWTKEAEGRMARVPPFVQGMARKAILEFAHQEGHTVITSDVVDQAMAAFLPRSAQEAMGIIAEVGSVRGASAPLSWSLKASGRLEGVPAGVMRGAMRLRAEALARDKASRKVTLQIVEEALAAGRLVMEARMKHLQSEATQQGAERRIDSVSRRPGGRKSRCPFAGLSASIDAAAEERIDSRKVSAAPRWTEQATRLLETVPEGFIRRMTRARVEALARRKGCLEVTSEVVTEKLKSWRDNSLKAGITMSWDSAVLERVQRIPETVRGQIILEVERFAASQGRKEITNSFFEKVVNQWMNGMDFHQKKTPWETAHDLPEEFIRWQLSTRREILHQIAKRRPITVFNTHLAVVSTMRNNGQFPIHSSIKETGFLPKDDHLDEGLEAVEACLDRIKGRPFDRSAAERLAAVWEFYNHTERIDSRKMGLLEVSRGRTFKNLAESPRATLLYTGAEPERAKFQFNCVAEIVGPEDHRFRFLCGMLQLLDYERFHIHRPAYPLGYLFWVQEIVDMTPVVGGEASRIAQGPGSGPEDVPS